MAGASLPWDTWQEGPDGRRRSQSGFFLLPIAEGSHGGCLSRMTELVEKCLWAFSEHQLSEGPEVPGSQGKKKTPFLSKKNSLILSFSISISLPLQGWGQNPGYLLGKGFFVESCLQYLPPWDSRQTDLTSPWLFTLFTLCLQSPGTDPCDCGVSHV